MHIMAATHTTSLSLLLLCMAVAGTLALGAPEGRLLVRVSDAKEPVARRTATARRVKAAKSTKSSKSKKRALAFLGPAPGYEGTVLPSGTVTVTHNPDGAFLLTLDAAGLDPACVDDADCQVRITKGTSCDAPFGDDPADTGHYVADDPWGDVTFGAYNSSEMVFSNSAWRVDNGYTLSGNLGHAVVVYKSLNRVGCGVLVAADGAVDRDIVLKAEMGRYPGYTGAVAASGAVTVSYRADWTFEFAYDLAGLEADCTGCGIHIHAGLSCANAQDVKGHGWNTDVVQDLWTAAGGATYATDPEGVARGHFNTYNGYSFGKNMGHAVVIHAQDGTRVGCGVLGGVVV